MRPLAIEFLWWEGCPSHPEARARLAAALARADAAAVIDEREVTTEAQAHAETFYGSPTIRIEGLDVEVPAVGTEPSLGCRIYSQPGGRVGPVPTAARLDAAIQEAIRHVAEAR
jgi:hypothetical protein